MRALGRGIIPHTRSIAQRARTEAPSTVLFSCSCSGNSTRWPSFLCLPCSRAAAAASRSRQDMCCACSHYHTHQVLAVLEPLQVQGQHRRRGLYQHALLGLLKAAAGVAVELVCRAQRLDAAEAAQAGGQRAVGRNLQRQIQECFVPARYLQRDKWSAANRRVPAVIILPGHHSMHAPPHTRGTASDWSACPQTARAPRCALAAWAHLAPPGVASRAPGHLKRFSHIA